MSLNSLIVFPLVLSDLGVTKPLLLSHVKRVFQVTLLVSVKIRLYGVLLSRFTLNKKKNDIASAILFVTVSPVLHKVFANLYFTVYVQFQMQHNTVDETGRSQ